jgi:LysM repeat protein
VRIAVFVVLAIHGIGLLALLMQGCKKEPETPIDTAAQADTNTPAFAEPTNALSADTNPVAVAPTNVQPIEPVTPTPVPPVGPTGVATEYKVVRGDTYTSIAKKFNVTTKAITEANPGVDPTKLRIDQVLKIPAPSAPAATTGGAPGTALSPDASGTQVYVVKSGDTLIGIAGRFGVSVKAIRAANNLATDRIKVGQKLTIPAKAPAPAGGTTAPSGGTPTGAAPVGQ